MVENRGNQGIRHYVDINLKAYPTGLLLEFFRVSRSTIARWKKRGGVPVAHAQTLIIFLYFKHQQAIGRLREAGKE